MLNLKVLVKPVLFLLSLNLQMIAYADINGIDVIGSETIILPKSDTHASEKLIKLNKIKLSDNFKENFKLQLKDINNFSYVSKLHNSDFDADVGMENVPVLDQGKNNTCALFAISAWLNANKKAGDYLSQQCLLELGVYLSQTYGDASGWDGISSGSVYLDRVNNYGAVKKSACPHQYADKTQIMDSDTYWNYSSGKWSQQLRWNSIQAKDVDAVRQALSEGKRVYIEVLLHKNYVPGFPINGHKEGLWALPTDANERENFINDIYNNTNTVGHALVVTAYSDKKGYFKVRNSWGPQYGDKGEFYMSYDFYRLMDYDAMIMD